MKIIGICGTNGSGKDTLADMLAKRHGWLSFSYSEYLRDEARKRGLSIERKNLSAISSELRAKYGSDILTRKAVELFDKSRGKYNGLFVHSMRHPGEAKKVKELGGTVVWLDGDPKVRYERTTSRARSKEDMKSYEDFLAEQESEMRPSGKSTLEMAKVKEMADIFLQNNGDNLENFINEAEEALKKLL